MKTLQLDGSEGGGQMLRSALTLALVTGKPFRMTHIRSQRRKPGLMRQHLTCVHAAREISGGSADGAEIGSTELVFHAGTIKPGDYRFAIGTAGSTGLLLQTLLPALAMADKPSTLHLSGGTHNPLAPPVDFLERIHQPALQRMGFHAAPQLRQHGFAPAGGGEITCTITPSGRLAPLDLTDRGNHESTRIRIPFRNLSADIAKRMLQAALKILPCEDARIDQLPDGPGQGVACLIECGFTNTRAMSCAFGEMGVSAEKVGHRAARMMDGFLTSNAAVDLHLADQLLLPMALAGGGRFTTVNPDDHVATNIRVIETFLPVKFEVKTSGNGVHEISCDPLG